MTTAIEFTANLGRSRDSLGLPLSASVYLLVFPILSLSPLIYQPQNGTEAFGWIFLIYLRVLEFFGYSKL